MSTGQRVFFLLASSHMSGVSLEIWFGELGKCWPLKPMFLDNSKEWSLRESTLGGARDTEEHLKLFSSLELSRVCQVKLFFHHCTHQKSFTKLYMLHIVYLAVTPIIGTGVICLFIYIETTGGSICHSSRKGLQSAENTTLCRDSGWTSSHHCHQLSGLRPRQTFEKT